MLFIFTAGGGSSRSLVGLHWHFLGWEGIGVLPCCSSDGNHWHHKGVWLLYCRVLGKVTLFTKLPLTYLSESGWQKCRFHGTMRERGGWNYHPAVKKVSYFFFFDSTPIVMLGFSLESREGGIWTSHSNFAEAWAIVSSVVFGSCRAVFI